MLKRLLPKKNEGPENKRYITLEKVEMKNRRK